MAEETTEATNGEPAKRGRGRPKKTAASSATRPAKQKPLPGFGPTKKDKVLDPLAIQYYDKVIERLAVQAEEKDLKGRLEFAMEQKQLLYYQASDGTEVEYPAAERKLKVKRKTDGDNALDTSDDSNEE